MGWPQRERYFFPRLHSRHRLHGERIQRKQHQGSIEATLPVQNSRRKILHFLRPSAAPSSLTREPARLPLLPLLSKRPPPRRQSHRPQGPRKPASPRRKASAPAAKSPEWNEQWN